METAVAAYDFVDKEINIKDWRITLPDNSWSKKYNYLTDGWDFYKSGHHDTLNSSLSIYISNLNAEESCFASEQLSRSFSDVEILELTYLVNDTNCPAYEQHSQQYNKTVYKAFYPLNAKMCLQINILERVGNTQGIDPESEEVKLIIQNIIEKNEFPKEVMINAGEEIIITEDNINFDGELFEIEGFSVLVPDGWGIFPITYRTYRNKYLGTYIIKGGSSTDDYGLKPSITIYVNEENAYTSYITDRIYHDNSVELDVNICGINCYAFQYTEEIKYKNEYWTYIKIFLPFSDSKNVSFKVTTESSEFEGIDILDDDVRQIIISMQQNIS